MTGTVDGARGEHGRVSARRRRSRTRRACRGPLAGLLVADFSRILAGPVRDDAAGRPRRRGGQGRGPRRRRHPHLAAAGARRASRPTTSGVNRNKRSIALDLKDAADAAAVARSWPARADVLVENFKPGRAGAGSASTTTPWRPTNPGVVYASISGFGSGPEGAALPGYDLIVQAISGLMSLTGDPDGEPYRAGISVFDVMAGLHATIGVLAALHAPRTRPGAASTSRSTCCPRRCPGWSTSPARSSPAASCPFRMGNSHPSLFPYEPLPCADGDLIITAGNDGQFRKLVEVLGVPELADDPRFARNEDRTANRDELRPLLVERLRTRTEDGVVPRHHRRRRAVRADQHHRRGRRLRRGASASTRWSTSARATPPSRRCATRSPSPRPRRDYRLPPPALDEHGDEIRALAGGAAGRGARMSDLQLSRPRSAPRPPTRSGCSARTSPPT